ncbi:hypothetical protein BHM03_00021295 [Ensete ventricosum]|nr:hypothetical protein BHM03_00021295 [Ensete ventricosum]
MLDYEWGNPAAVAPAMLLFGEENGGDDLVRQHATVFDHFAGHGIGSGGSIDFFPQAQPLTAASLFPAPAPASSTWHQRNGMEFPPLPARIGLNLGVRTYFSSASPAEGGLADPHSSVPGRGMQHGTHPSEALPPPPLGVRVPLEGFRRRHRCRPFSALLPAMQLVYHPSWLLTSLSIDLISKFSETSVHERVGFMF